MTEFYPGSKTPKKIYGDNYKPPVDNDDLELGKPRLYSVHGKSVNFYTLGALAAALNRKPGTVRKWETEGIIPQPTFFKPSDDFRGQRRLYTKEQIEGLRSIAREEGLLEPTGKGKWKSIEETEFPGKALKLFKSLEGK